MCIRDSSKTVLNAIRTTPVAPVYNEEYGLYTSLPEFQKAQMNNPMVDVNLRANTTRAVNYRASGSIYGEVDFLKHFTFKAMFSMDYACLLYTSRYIDRDRPQIPQWITLLPINL